MILLKVKIERPEVKSVSGFPKSLIFYFPIDQWYTSISFLHMFTNQFQSNKEKKKPRLMELP